MSVVSEWKSLSRVQLFAVHGILQARILEWVAVPFSRESSQPRDQTQVSHIADRFFTSWATREAEQLLFWTSFYQEFSSYIYYWILVISLFSHISVKVIVQEGKKAWKLKLQLCWNDTRETHYYHDTKIKDTVRKRNHRIKFLKKTNVLGDYMVVYICQNSKLPTWEGWVLVTLLKLYLNKFNLKKKKKKHRCKSVTKDKQLRNA